MGRPAISVIMPAYNRASMIGEAVESVLGQTLREFELLVVDDGSTDGTCAAVEAYDDPRVRLIKLDRNKGSNAARNAGIEAARAPILAFLDSDDLYLPDRLERVVRYFGEHPDIDVWLDSFVRQCSPRAGRESRECRSPETRTTEDFSLALFRRQLHKATTSIAVRRDAAVRAGGFAEGVRQRQDFEFLIRLTEIAKCASTAEIGWVKGWSPDRITSRERFVEASLELVRRHPQYLNDPRYRPGLARDLVRNSLMLARKGRFGAVGRDVRRVAGMFGAAETVRLAGRGLAELATEGLRRRPKPAPCAPASPAVRSALEAARNRGSGRS